MNLLAIAIPTYNSSTKVLAQCENLAFQIEEAGLGEDVTLIVSDNASSDNTKTLLESSFSTKRYFKYSRNRENVGLVGNYLRCLQLSQCRFTWVVGDDDEIDEGAVADIFVRLRNSPELKVLFLNFLTKNGATGETSLTTYYPSTLSGQFSGEQAAKEILDEVGHSAWLWITGSVLSTATALEATRYCGSRENLAIPLMVPMFACCMGMFEISAKPRLTMVIGTTSWAKKYYRRISAIDLPRVLFRLRRLDYDFVEIPHFRRVLQNRWIALVGDFRRRGIFSILDYIRL